MLAEALSEIFLARANARLSGVTRNTHQKSIQRVADILLDRQG